jgi:hypothetical protein
MGEHNDNPMALLKKTLPQFPPVGRDGEGRLGLRVVPKRNVILVLADATRVIEGETQVRRSDEAVWEKVPDGVLVRILGERLSDDELDVAVVLAVAWVDISTMNGRDAPRAGMHFVPGELTRVDYRAFLHNAEASLPEEHRIVTAGLKLMKE